MASCPNCTSTYLRPAHPTFVERLRAIGRKADVVECWHCGWRGRVTLLPDPGPVADEQPGGAEEPDGAEEPRPRPRAAAGG